MDRKPIRPRGRARIWNGPRGQWIEETMDVDNPNTQDPPREFPRLPDITMDYTPLPAGTRRTASTSRAVSTSTNANRKLTRTELIEAEDWIRRHGMDPIQVTVRDVAGPFSSSTVSASNRLVVETGFITESLDVLGRMEDDNEEDNTTQASAAAAAAPAVERAEIYGMDLRTRTSDSDEYENSGVDLEEESEMSTAETSLSPSHESEVAIDSDSEDLESVSETDTASEDQLMVARERARDGTARRTWETDPLSIIPKEFAQVGQIPLVHRIHRDGRSYFAEISAASGPDNFYVTLHKQRSSKKTLHKNINDTYNTYVRNKKFPMPEISTLVPGLPVVCAHNFAWYRAEILSVKTLGDSIAAATSNPDIMGPVVGCVVLLIDVGTQHYVPISTIRYMRRELLKHRAMATRCVLLKTNEGVPWDRRAVNRFRELVTPESQIRMKYIDRATTDSNRRTWIVKFKMDIPDGVNPHVKLHRTVDIGTEIRSTARRLAVASMYIPIVDDESGFGEFSEERHWGRNNRIQKKRQAKNLSKVNPNSVIVSELDNGSSSASTST